MSVRIASTLDSITKFFDRAPDATPKAARMALNKVIAGKGRTIIKAKMHEQVAFPAGYVDNEKLSVGRRATDNVLEASLVGRQRPTSLATFATNKSVEQSRKQGVQVMVHPGRRKSMRRAFLMRLRRGEELGEDNFNLGLAIRLKPGEQIENRRSVSFNGDASLQLLYGPSVDQVMLDAAAEGEPEIMDEVETEFVRNFVRLTE